MRGASNEKEHERWSRLLSTLPKGGYAYYDLSRFGVDGKSVKEVVTDGQSQFEVMKCLAENFPSAAAVTIMDLSVEAEAFGSPVAFHDDDVPTVTTNIVSDKASI